MRRFPGLTARWAKLGGVSTVALVLVALIIVGSQDRSHQPDSDAAFKVGPNGEMEFVLGEPIYSADLSPLTACRMPSSSRIGGIIIDPIERTLFHIRASNTCNQPDPSTAKATRSTWDTAHAIVRARGASITKSCEPTCSPDDWTKVWIVEVHGTFVPPESIYDAAMVPDSKQAEQTPPNTPVAGTWFSIIPVLNY